MQTGSKFANYIDRWKKDVVCKTDLEIFVKTAQKQKENSVRVCAFFLYEFRARIDLVQR